MLVQYGTIWPYNNLLNVPFYKVQWHNFSFHHSLALIGDPVRSQEDTYIQVLQSEDHRVGHKHTAGLLCDGGWQDVGVDSEGEIVFVQIPHSPQRGVLCAEELTQVLVEHKHQLGHTCNRQLKKIW